MQSILCASRAPVTALREAQLNFLFACNRWVGEKEGKGLVALVSTACAYDITGLLLTRRLKSIESKRSRCE